MFIRTDDPIRDHMAWEQEQERQLAHLPKCAECGEPIQQEKAVYIDGHYYCDDCLEDNRILIGEER